MEKFLLQLACEYYQFMGFFIRRNLKFGEFKLSENSGEIELLAYNYKENILFHFETAQEVGTWDNKIAKLTKKFNEAELYYSDYVNTTDIQIQRVSVIGTGEGSIENIKQFEKKTRSKLLNIKEFLKHIKVEVMKHDPYKELMPEGYPLLRAIQLAITI